jgi:hypothetical protein
MQPFDLPGIPTIAVLGYNRTQLKRAVTAGAKCSLSRYFSMRPDTVGGASYQGALIGAHY